MCGIIAAIAERNVVPILMEGLKKLEYRGYDSAGMTVIKDDHFMLYKAKGKVTALHELIQQQNPNIKANIGIAHTRWATHGKPSTINAHPHIINDTIALVHNGIIENYQALKSSISEQHTFTFKSDTDSEVIAAKIYFYKLQGLDFKSAVIKTCKELRGSYSICVMDLLNPEQIIAARFGSPLVIGVGVGEYFVASDSLALQHLTQHLIYLKDGDVAKITDEGVEVYGFSGKKINRNSSQLTIFQDAADKGKYRHFMLKEIFEQPKAITATIEGRIVNDIISENFLGVNAKQILNLCNNVQIIGCGTSFHAGLIAKHWLETFVGIHSQVDIASEFRYYDKVILPNTLMITISQSGETADTIGALRKTLSLATNELKKYCGFLTICNVPESSLIRYSELIALTQAGPEIGVASTKAFTAQLVMLLMLVAIFIERKQSKNNLTSKQIIYAIQDLPIILENFLKLSPQIFNVAKLFEHKKSTLFLARGLLFPLALEGALKLKELSYIHAEAHLAGELKHGPLALVDDQVPVVVLMSKDGLVDKLKSNIKEVQARGGKVIVFADQSISWEKNHNLQIIALPSVPYWLAPIAYAIPLQLLAYHVAVLKGTDVDQPRNLAKSVTVE